MGLVHDDGIIPAVGLVYLGVNDRELLQSGDDAIIDLDTITEQIEQKELSRAALTDFQKALQSRKAILTRFDPETWYNAGGSCYCVLEGRYPVHV